MTDLPPVLQVVASMAVIVIGGGLAFFGFTKTWLDKFLPERAKSKANATDAVVVSGAFADGKPIAELNAGIATMNALLHEVRDATRENTAAERETAVEVRRVGDRVLRVCDLLTDRLPTPH